MKILRRLTQSLLFCLPLLALSCGTDRVNTSDKLVSNYFNNSNDTADFREGKVYDYERQCYVFTYLRVTYPD